MLNNKTTHNPIVWSDSPNSIFKLAYLSEQDIKYYCFGDGGGDGDGGAASDDVGGPPGDVDAETDAEFGEPTADMTAAEAISDTTAADAVGGLAGIADTGPTPTNPKVLTALAKRPFTLQQEILAKFEKDAREFNPFEVPDIEQMDQIPVGLDKPHAEFLGLGYTFSPKAAGLYGAPTYSNLGWSFSPGEFAADIVDVINPLAGFLGRQAIGLVDTDNVLGLNTQNPLAEMANIAGLFGLNTVQDNLGRAGKGVDAITSAFTGTDVQGGIGTGSISAAPSSPTSDAPSSPTSDDAFGDGGDPISRGLASIITQPPTGGGGPINPSTVNQPVSNISRSVRPPNQPLTVEETLGRATLGGGFNTRQAGGLVSLGNNKRTNPVFAQSGGNIGGLMNIGPNVIDVINRGIAMPENIGAVQMQEKIDINQSTPYTSR